MKPIALIDMDNTIANYDKAMIESLNCLTGPMETTINPITYEGYLEDWLNPRRQLIKNQPGWWYNLEPLEDGMILLDKILSIGYEVHILTKAPTNSNNAWSEKVKWSRKHLPKECLVTITEGDKSLVYGRVLVDDWPGYFEDWLKWRPRGIVIMPSRPHNNAYKPIDRVYKYSESELATIYDVLKNAYSSIRRE